MVFSTVLTCWAASSRGSESSLLWRLAIAVENGIPLAPEVEAAAIGAGQRRREALFGLADRLRDGRSLADSLEVGPRLLPRQTILAIRAAEKTDALPEILRAAADRGVRDLADLGGPQDLLPFQAYIVNVFVIAVAIVSFIMYFIIPKFVDIFHDFGVELPPVSRALIQAADGALSSWWIVTPLILVPVALVMLPPIVTLLGWQNLNFPLLMRWFPRRDAPDVLRTLAVAVDKRPLPEALADIASHHHREDMRRRLARLVEALHHGDCSWEILAREGFIRRAEAQALDAATGLGHLSWAMNALADVIEHRQRVREAWWAEWQRPLLVLVLAGLVAFIVFGLFSPLITLLNSLS
jgi:type II secretory pathway component PulF